MPDEPLAPALYLVATPIGNLEDITLRALRVLRSVDRIACEDTRQTQKLLNHFSIQTPTISYHQHNELSRSEQLVEDLRNGARIAVVSDAGTPAIADPGFHLAQAAIAAGIVVIPIPGANAAISAVSASGLPAERFTFHGFLPAKQGQRLSTLEALERLEITHVFYEAPHRLLDTLADVAATFGKNQHVAIARELTKLHEEFLRGSVAEISAKLSERPHVRGELVLMFALEEKTQAPAVESVSQAIEERRREGLTEMEALKQVAKTRGIGKSELYRVWQREQKRGKQVPTRGPGHGRTGSGR